MLVQIYEVTSPEEANALGDLGIDHIGVLVGDGSFPRELSIDHARLIFAAIPSSSKGLALLLTSDGRLLFEPETCHHSILGRLKLRFQFSVNRQHVSDGRRYIGARI